MAKSIPTALKGSTHIKSNHSERFNSESHYLTLRAASRINIFVLWPNRNRRPKWLYSKFHITPLVVSIDPAIFTLEVWEIWNTLAPGEYITLGGSSAEKGARDMTSYVVLVLNDSKKIIKRK